MESRAAVWWSPITPAGANRRATDRLEPSRAGAISCRIRDHRPYFGRGRRPSVDFSRPRFDSGPCSSSSVPADRCVRIRAGAVVLFLRTGCSCRLIRACSVAALPVRSGGSILVCARKSRPSSVFAQRSDARRGSCRVRQWRDGPCAAGPRWEALLRGRRSIACTLRCSRPATRLANHRAVGLAGGLRALARVPRAPFG